MKKLIDAGINSFILRWVTSYLCGRRQYVAVNGQRSPTSVVVSGVPQGSVLGPLLFLIYVNDFDSLPVSIDTLSSLFADDLLMYRIINTSEDYKELQSDVDIVCNWVDENKLAFNRNKCKYMVVSRLKSRAQLVEPMLLLGEPIERVSSYKYLGVILTDYLSWSMHIDRISVKQDVLLDCFTENSTNGLLLMLF